METCSHYKEPVCRTPTAAVTDVRIPRRHRRSGRPRAASSARPPWRRNLRGRQRLTAGLGARGQPLAVARRVPGQRVAVGTPGMRSRGRPTAPTRCTAPCRGGWVRASVARPMPSSRRDPSRPRTSGRRGPHTGAAPVAAAPAVPEDRGSRRAAVGVGFRALAPRLDRHCTRCGCCAMSWSRVWHGSCSRRCCSSSAPRRTPTPSRAAAHRGGADQRRTDAVLAQQHPGPRARQPADVGLQLQGGRTLRIRTRPTPAPTRS